MSEVAIELGKKQWETPVVEELSVDSTLGGPIKTKHETVMVGPASFGPNFGSIPGTGPF